MIPKKLPPIPKYLICTPCTITINQGLSEDGEELKAVEVETKCIFSEKRKQVMDAEKHILQLEGTAILLEDPAPSISFSTGSFTVYEKKYKLYAMKRPRNPDGTIHHITLELM